MALRRWLWIYILCTGHWAPHGAWLCFHCTINFGKDAWWMFIRPSRFWFVVLTSHSREWLNGIQSLGAGNTNVINYRTRCKLGNEFEFFIFFFFENICFCFVECQKLESCWMRLVWSFCDDLGVCWVRGMGRFPLLSQTLGVSSEIWGESQANP